MNQWRKGIALWRVGTTIYLSVPFTWLAEKARMIAEEWKGKGFTVEMGGPGFMEPTSCELFEPVLFHNPCATFTTRGCPNACPWCAVPKLEPEFKEIRDFRPAPVVCDNNLLAASWGHIKRVVERVRDFTMVDFNQGLEAFRFTFQVARELGKLRCKVRFAFDRWGDEGMVKDAIDLCRKRTTKDIGVFVLIGFKGAQEEDLARLDLVREWGIRPTPMRYQPLDAKEKNAYLPEEGWTEHEMLRTMKYYSRLRYYEHIPFDDFRNAHQGELFS